MLKAAQIRSIALPSVAPVAAGLALLGVSAYAVLGLAGHALQPREYAAVASLYLLTAIVGPGIFVAVEQETNREVSTRIASGAGTLPVVRSASLVSSGLAVAVALVLLLLSPVLVDRVLAGSSLLLVAALVAVAGSSAVYVLRGLYAGQQRYGWYAATLAGEGLGRLVPCLVLVAIGAAGAANFGFALALGTVVAAAVTVVGTRRGTAGSPVRLSSMASGVALLACASGLTLLVANIAPVVVTSRLTEDPRTAASFISVFMLARIPLFLFAPIHAFLLPSMTAAIVRGEAKQVRARARTVLIAVAGIGLPGAVCAGIFGPWAARVFFDAPVDLSMLVSGLLAASTVVMMAAQVIQPALVALGSHRVTTAAWTVGTLVFMVVLFAPVEPLAAAVAAQLVGPIIVVAGMAIALRKKLADLDSS